MKFPRKDERGDFSRDTRGRFSAHRARSIKKRNHFIRVGRVARAVAHIFSHLLARTLATPQAHTLPDYLAQQFVQGTSDEVLEAVCQLDTIEFARMESNLEMNGA